MRKLIFFIGVIIAVLPQVFSQITTPSLRCLFVKAEDNSVSLYFIPVDTNIAPNVYFLNYSVYSSDNFNGPYSLVGSAMSTCNTDAFDGLDPVIHNYYYIRATFTGGIFYNSDTLAVIKTTISTPQPGIAQITWDPNPYNPLPATSSTQYSIYRKNPQDFDFMYVGSVSAASPHTYRDTIGVCNDLVKYRVQLNNAWTLGTCRNSSTISQDIFQNSIAPNIPTLTNVSVDYVTDGINLSWLPSNNTDVNAYIIFHSATPITIWTPVDTVWGRMNTTWIDPNNGSNTINNYRISSRDSCGLSSAMTINYQSNMRLTSTVDECHYRTTLQWTPYNNMTNNLSKYEIHASINGMPPTYISEVGPNENSYTYSGLVDDFTYCFVIKAVSTGNTYISNSNKDCFTFSVEERNDFVYVAAVSVVEDKDLKITINTSGDQYPFDYLEIYRSEDNLSNFSKIADIPFSANSVYNYTDYDLKVLKKIYYYKVLLYSECLPAPVSSNVSNSILLTGVGDAAHRNQLQWFNYDDNVPTTEYPTAFIQRKMESDGDFVEIQSNILWSAYNSYVDDVAELHQFGADFKYKVGVNQKINEYGFCPISLSNEITIRQKPTIWIPNAFRPIGSINKVFKPINSFVSADTYSFVIYNRIGQIVFQTTNPNEGWEGRLSNGEFAPAGVYIYKIQFLDTSDEIFITNGTVSLIY